MTKRVWDKFLTERDKQVFAAAGYGARSGFGKRPALLVIDVNYGFVGDKPEPILESIKRWMNSCGEDGWRAVAAIKEVLVAARGKVCRSSIRLACAAPIAGTRAPGHLRTAA
jgi:maleamate amidohydrolase